MDIVHPSARDEFRRQQIRAIEREMRREFAARIRLARTRQEKKALNRARDAEIATRTAPLVREGGPFPPPGHCRNCGYNLTGNVTGICPECGTPIETA